MKHIGISLLLAGAILCVPLAGCTSPSDENNVTVTENTDPVALKGEEVTREKWNAAFSAQESYTAKVVLKLDQTEKEAPMSETTTVIYEFDGDNIHVLMNGDTQGEAYVSIEGEEATLWSRSKEGADWTEWSGESYPLSALTEIPVLASLDGFGFLKDRYSDFSYGSEEKGYVATGSGLGGLQTDVCKLLSAALDELGEDVTCDAESFVVKLNGGKTSAYLIHAAVTSQAESEAPPEDEAEGGAGQDGSPKEDGPKEEGPVGTNAKIVYTQLFYGYGDTKVTLPKDLPEVSKSIKAPTMPEMPFAKRI